MVKILLYQSPAHGPAGSRWLSGNFAPSSFSRPDELSSNDCSQQGSMRWYHLVA
jgi:hypothetical protein